MTLLHVDNNEPSIKPLNEYAMKGEVGE